MSDIARAFRVASRRLLAVPGFSASVVLTLALGIGATTAVFSVVNAVLLRPLPYRAPDRLMSLSHSVAISGISRVDQSDATLLFYQRQNTAFTNICGYRTISVNLGAPSGTDVGAAEPERVLAGRVSAGLFPMLGVPPLAGRGFTESDDRVGAQAVVVIGERLWRRKYGSDPSLVGRVVAIDAVPHEVVGIMPAGLRFPTPETDAWVPLRLDPARTDSASFDYQAIGRLRDGIAPAAAAADLQAALPRVPDAFPGRLTASSLEQIQMRAVVRPLHEVVVGDNSRLLWVVLGAAAFVLAAACANVANLFLVRADVRRNEVAMRKALGASRRALALDCIAESLALAAVGGTLGVGIAVLGLSALPAVGSGIELARLPEVDLDATVLMASAVSTLLAALAASALPAWRSSRTAVSNVLAQTGRTATAGRQRHRARKALIVSQVALALVLLAGSSLMARSFIMLRTVQPGIEAKRALVFRVAVPDTRYETSVDAARFFARTVEEIADIPGVQSVGVVSKLPLDSVGKLDTAVFVEDRPRPPNAIPNIHDVAYITPDYFAAMGIALFEGRTLERPDPDREPREVVVSRGFAERYWKDESALGRRVRILVNGPWFTVVGVAGHVRTTALERDPDETIYCPIVTAAADARWKPRDLAFVVRTARDPSAITRPIRDVVRRADPSVPIYGARPMTDILARASARTSATFLMLAAASMVALLLGATGVYGVMSYVVSLRTREIGVRLALGAQPSDVRWMVSRHAAASVAVGIAVGLAGATTLTRFLSTLLYEVSPTDPVAFAAAGVSLGVVGLVASWIPARRAARVDPLTAMRIE